MAIWKDILEEVQLSEPLRERIKLRDEQYERLQEENSGLKRRIAELEHETGELRAQLPASPAGDLEDADRKLLVLLFRSGDDPEPAPFEEPVRSDELRQLARGLGLDLGATKYRLERLEQRGLAEAYGWNAAYGHTYWTLTSSGRAYVVENGLVG